MGWDWDSLLKGGNIPNGEYMVRVEKLELSESKSSGNKLAKYTCKIINSEVKESLFPIVVLTDNAIWKLAAFIKACGVTPSEEHKRCELNSPEFVKVLKLPLGRNFIAVVENKERNGFTNPEIVKFKQCEVQENKPEDLPPWEGEGK